MKIRGMFTSLGTRTIAGRRVQVAQHKRMNYFRIGTCNIPADTLEGAIEKYQACQARRHIAEHFPVVE